MIYLKILKSRRAIEEVFTELHSSSEGDVRFYRVPFIYQGEKDFYFSRRGKFFMVSPIEKSINAFLPILHGYLLSDDRILICIHIRLIAILIFGLLLWRAFMIGYIIGFVILLLFLVGTIVSFLTNKKLFFLLRNFE